MMISIDVLLGKYMTVFVILTAILMLATLFLVYRELKVVKHSDLSTAVDDRKYVGFKFSFFSGMLFFTSLLAVSGLILDRQNNREELSRLKSQCDDCIEIKGDLKLRSTKAEERKEKVKLFVQLHNDKNYNAITRVVSDSVVVNNKVVLKNTIPSLWTKHKSQKIRLDNVSPLNADIDSLISPSDEVEIDNYVAVGQVEGDSVSTRPTAGELVILKFKFNQKDEIESIDNFTQTPLAMGSR